MTHLPVDQETALLQVDGFAPPVAAPAQQQSVTRIVAPKDRRRAVVVPGNQEIRAPVPVEIVREHRADRGELSFGGKRCEGEGAVPVVQGDGAREGVRLTHGRLRELRRGENILDAACPRTGVMWGGTAQLRRGL